jgi:hypothetical protein
MLFSCFRSPIKEVVYGVRAICPLLVALVLLVVVLLRQVGKLQDRQTMQGSILTAVQWLLQSVSLSAREIDMQQCCSGHHMRVTHISHTAFTKEPTSCFLQPNDQPDELPLGSVELCTCRANSSV